MKIRDKFLLLLMLAGMVSASACAQPARETWLGGISPVGQKVRHLSDPTYMQMFEPGAPWKVSGGGLTVFKLSTQTIDGSSDADLRLIFAGLRERHIKLALEMGLISGPVSGTCGRGIEGFTTPNTAHRVLEHVKNLGGVVDYIAMDEPIIFGHRPLKQDGTGGCQLPLDQLADNIAEQIKAIWEVFPNLQIGDVEGVGGGPTGGPVNRDIVQLAALLRQRTSGKVPAFFHADVQWATPGTIPAFEQLAQMLHKRQIPVGVICDGGGRGITTGQQWVANAVQRCQMINRDGKIGADEFVVQTWEPLPNKMLPENDPGSLTFGLKQIEQAVGVGRR